MRNSMFLVLLAIAVGACTAQPEAPDLATDTGVAVTVDSGTPIDPPWDSGPDLLADAGSTDVEILPQDVGTIDPGEYDAGFTPPDPA